MTEVRFDQVTKIYGNGFEAVSDLDLEVADGELLVVVGPSGCGKTTTLRMLAGLEDITRGTISIGERTVNNLNARERDIAMVFQSYALYPHLTVADNLSYPLRMAKVPKAQRRERVLTVARQLRLEEMLDRKPRQLSGGQRQRVAMGRAMVRQPQVFLMDEPLSNLDAKLRVVMRSEVAELQRELATTMFYVTHDQIEAMTMGDRVAIMDRGVLQQVAPPQELYRAPANLFVAGFIGSPPMNLFSAAVHETGEQAAIRSGEAEFRIAARPSADLTGADRSDPEIVLGVRPEHVRFGGDEDALGGTVRLVEMLGSESLVHVQVDGFAHHGSDSDTAEETGSTATRILAKVPDGGAIPRVGEGVRLRFDTVHMHAFDLSSGAVMSRAAFSA